MKTKLALLSFIVLLITTACSGKDSDSFINNENDSDRVDDPAHNTGDKVNINSKNIEVGDTVLSVTLVDNSSVDAIKEALAEAPIKVDMRDYGNMEKVGSLGRDFPRNDESINAGPGDVILYQGRNLVIYYASNSWSFTRLGKIENITGEELKAVLGDGNVTVTLSLPGNE